MDNLSMVQIKADSVKEYLDHLPKDRQRAIEKVRKVILDNLPEGYEEGIQYGMIGYFVPLSIYPDGYLGDRKTPLPYVALASQKQHMSLYLNNIYADKKLYDWFVSEYKKTGKRMDIGKSCVRFRMLEDLPLELVGKAVAKTSVKEHIKNYKKARNK